MNARLTQSALRTGVLAAVGATVLGLAGCRERPASGSSPGAEPAAPPPADSLVTTTPDGAEIWFTLSRPDSGGGGPCTDRAIEIRRAGRRVPVPLLYTGTAPEILDDTTMRARLSSRCQPGDAYLVDLRTGRPVREHR